MDADIIIKQYGNSSIRLRRAKINVSGFNDLRLPRSKMTPEKREKERRAACDRAWEKQFNEFKATHISFRYVSHTSSAFSFSPARR